MATTVVEIQNRLGEVLYKERARSRKELIQRLVSEGRSLGGAYLPRAQLAGVDLSGADLRGACLDGADLRGAILKGARLDNASLSPHTTKEGESLPTRLSGADCTEAIFDAANMTEAVASGAVFTRARFNRTILDGADLSATSCGSAMFVHGVTAFRTNFANASMVNADFSHSTFVGCDFSGADVSDKVLGNAKYDGYSKVSPHLPDRTLGSRFVSCIYDRATRMRRSFVETPVGGVAEEVGLGPCTVPGMHGDRRLSRATRLGVTMASVFAIVEGTEHVLSAVGVGAVTGVGAAVAAAGLLAKEMVGEWAKEKVEEALLLAARRIRSAVLSVWDRSRRHAEIVCLIGSRMSLDPIRLALRAKVAAAAKEGIPSVYEAFTTGLGEVIVCDRRHLSLALAAMSSNRLGAGPGPLCHDIVMIRCDGRHVAGSAPCVITLLSDGRASAVWPLEGGLHAITVYAQDGSLQSVTGPEGELVEDFSTLGLPNWASCRDDVAMGFERTLMEDHARTGFEYRPETHYTQHGRDGSVIVRRISDNKVDNPVGPAILRPDGTGVVVEGSSVRREWIPDPAAARRDVAASKPVLAGAHP